MAWENLCPKCRGPLTRESFGLRCAPCNQVQHATGHENPQVAAVIHVLQDWFEALEEGTAASRFPDPDYRRRNGKPDWTDAEVDRVIDTIEMEAELELRPRANYWSDRGFDAPPRFDRLGPVQRRAFVQNIDNAFRTPTKREPEEPIAYG